VQHQAPEGWAGVADRGTQVLLDVRLTEELTREGMARDVVRQGQMLRKESKLQIEDRIVLHLATDSAPLRPALDAPPAHIPRETLTVRWDAQPDGGHRKRVKVEGNELTIELRKA